MSEMETSKWYPGMVPALILVLLIFYPGVITHTADAADASYEGYFGDVVDIHGVSYVGNEVYLFLTGPGLPVNGVTLSDTTQRADQGHFTIIPVDSSQQWSYKWNTQRLKSQLDPGTYTVYVTTEPVDLSNLGGSSSYKTLEVFLRDTNAPQGESGPGTYTLNPEKYTSTPMPTIVMGSVNRTASSNFSAQALTTPVPVTPVDTGAATIKPIFPTTTAGLSSGLPVIAIMGVMYILCIRRFHH